MMWWSVLAWALCALWATAVLVAVFGNLENEHDDEDHPGLRAP